MSFIQRFHCIRIKVYECVGNLRGMTPSEGVYPLYCGEEWEREIMPNVRHIVRGVVQGTAYLHENMSIQHVDLKGDQMYI